MKKIFMMLVGLLMLLTSCNPKRIDTCTPIYVMDTVVNITFYNVDDYKVHYDKIKKIYQDVDNVSNDFESNSQCNGVYDLNTSRSVEGNDILIELINSAVNMMNDTNGYYNPFIGRIAHLWKNAIKNNNILDGNTIIQELEIMNSTSVEIVDYTISLKGEGNLDLGGIAKGFATQKAKEYLDSEGIKGYLINAGNSNIVYGEKFGEEFKIGFNKPYDDGLYAVVQTNNNAIGTSSPKYQYIEVEGVRYHHLLNPYTGYPMNYYDSVNILCDNSMYCDVYSTAIYSMDLETVKEFEVEKQINVLLYKNNDIIYKSNGWIMVD